MDKKINFYDISNWNRPSGEFGLVTLAFSNDVHTNRDNVVEGNQVPKYIKDANNQASKLREDSVSNATYEPVGTRQATQILATQRESTNERAWEAECYEPIY